MIRIKVVEASKLVFAAVLLALIILLAVLAARALFAKGAAPAAAPVETAVWAQEQKAAAAFAAAASRPRVRVVFEAAENEHTDPVSGFEVEPLPQPSPSLSPAPTPGRAPRVLIYHTHTHEAYAQTAGDPYIETEKWRTADQNHSIVRVGERLAEALRGYGMLVTHDRTDHEPPELGTAYTRSLETVRSYGAGAFDLAIDLHRDAYAESIQGARAVSVGGAELAQLMALVGNGEGFADKPDTAANLAFAKRLTDAVNARSSGLCRPVLVKTGRYNQHVCTPSVLIEVGHNLNTLREALASQEILAASLHAVLSASRAR